MPRSAFRLELLVLLLAIGAAAGGAFALTSVSVTDEIEAYLRVVARTHPLVVHFPIALLAVALVFDVLFRKKEGECGDAAYWTLLLGALGAVVATIAGWLHGALEPHGSSQRDLLEQHRWVAVASTVAALVAAFSGFVYRTNAKPAWLVPWRGGLVVSILLVSIGGHLGGSLVYGEGHLFEPLEALRAKSEPVTGTVPADSAVGPAAAAATIPEIAPGVPVDFATVVRPILDRHCVECHGEKKKKGLLRFDRWNERIAGLKKGSKEPAVIPGKPDESPLVTSMELPLDHEDVMPPPENPRMDPREIALLRRWVAEGASWPKEDAGADPEAGDGTEPAENGDPADGGGR